MLCLPCHCFLQFFVSICFSSGDSLCVFPLLSVCLFSCKAVVNEDRVGSFGALLEENNALRAEIKILQMQLHGHMAGGKD